jgi:hypothetical protein
MPEPEAIQWDSWPLRDEPARKTALLLLFTHITVFLAALDALFSGILAALLLFVLLGPYFLRARYEVSDRGVVKRFPLFNRERPWDAYQRYAVQRDGVFLGTFEKPSRLDSFRGDFLRFAGGVDRVRVLEIVGRHLSRKPASGVGER